MFGVHRFYVGKTGTGIVWLLTFGCFIGYLVDFILIATGLFYDADGKQVLVWTRSCDAEEGSPLYGLTGPVRPGGGAIRRSPDSGASWAPFPGDRR